MNMQEALKNGIEILKSVNNEAPVLEAGVILCSVLKCDKTFLYSHDKKELTNEEQNIFFECMNSRASGKPLQYITGHQEFMSLDFLVTPDVLIPRQDTEILVETVMHYVNNVIFELPIAHSQLPIANILDIGTGSGCIGISLAFYLQNANITAVDISDKALETAKLNANLIGVDNRITFRKSSVFDSLVALDLKFDVIVSNPPYIPTSHIEGLQIEVRSYEPLGALDGGTDGLDFYRTIIKAAPQFLKTNGLLAFEVGYDQACEVSELMSDNYYEINVYKDLNNISRVVTGRLIHGG